MTSDSQLKVLDEETTGKIHPFPKPRFLDNLESFVKKELRVLGVSEMLPSELRLQVKVCFYLGVCHFLIFFSFLQSL